MRLEDCARSSWELAVGKGMGFLHRQSSVVLRMETERSSTAAAHWATGHLLETEVSRTVVERCRDELLGRKGPGSKAAAHLVTLTFSGGEEED